MKHGWLRGAGSQMDAGLTSAAAQVSNQDIMLTTPTTETHKDTHKDCCSV